jgi:hypothetical protein
MFKFDFYDKVQMTREKFTSLLFEKCSTTGIIVNRYVNVNPETLVGTYVYEVEIKINDFSTTLIKCEENEIELFKEEI